MHEGKIYVCDTGGAVIVFDLEKKTYGQLKGAQGQGKLVQPINISIDKEGNKYVTDTLRKVVVIFDRNDEYVRTLGIKEKWNPVDAVRYEDRIYISDPDNSEIKVFDSSSGDLIKKFGSGSLDRPLNLAFDERGYLFVSDLGRFQVLKFDRDGHLLQTIGKLGMNYGHFSRPRGVAVDRSGKLYVVDASFYNVQVFRENGQLLTFFGGGGAMPGSLTLPAKVSLNYDNKKYFEQYLSPNFEMEYLVLVTSQFGERMVSVYAFGKEKGKQYPTDAQLDEELKENLLKNAQKEFKRNVRPEGAADEGPPSK
jgi:DNA-binding beta-propeller fold protein YncE